MIDYSYQKKLISDTISGLEKHKDFLLAACPGAGKTVMTIEIVKQFLKKRPRASVLILAYSQVMIREQWFDFFKKQAPKIELSRWRKEHTSVQIDLPQTLYYHTKYLRHYDLVVVDEAHLWLHSKTVKTILRKTTPTYLLKLTGTPSRLLKKAQHYTGITVDELLDKKVISDVNVQLVKSPYKIGLKDYLNTFHLRSETKFPTTQTEHLVDDLLSGLHLNSSKKQMIVCHSQNQAYDVSKHLTKNKIKNILSISLENRADKAIKLIHKFKNSNHNKLIVVNRGILGFDFDELETIIDMSGTLNVDRIFQTLCRVNRRSKKEKQFIKITTNETQIYSYYIMNYVLSLCLEKNYFSSHSDFRLTPNRILMPNKYIEFIKVNARHIKNMDSFRRLDLIHEILTFKEIKRRSGDTEGFAEISFSQIRRIIGSARVWDEDSFRSIAVQCQNYKQLRLTYGGAYEWALKHRPDLIKKYFGDVRQHKGKRWDKNRLLVLLNQCKTRKELKEKSWSAYNHAIKYQKDLINEFYPRREDKWNLQRAKAACKIVNNRLELRTNYKGAYNFLMKKDRAYLDALFGDTNPSHHHTYDLENVLKVTSQYKVKSHFREAHHGMFLWLKRNAHLDKCNFKKNPYRIWTVKAAVKKAKTYKNAHEFNKKASGAADFLRIKHRAEYRKLFPIQKHVPLWSYEKAVKASKQYTRMGKFKTGSFTGYNLLRTKYPKKFKQIQESMRRI